jgi:hypothetical protein
LVSRDLIDNIIEISYLEEKLRISKTEDGAAIGLVDFLTCPLVWLPTYSGDQARMDGLS